METPEQFAKSLSDYLLTRNKPWGNEQEVREAVGTAVGIIFGESSYTTARLLPGYAITDLLGQADWKWDDDLEMHIPCCTQLNGTRKCGNGPLDPNQIPYGNCGLTHESSNRTS